MNGASALIQTLVASGVDTCFMNPGTSEMHFVAALDNEPGMRGILALFEGVATGAADGYARMTGKPAATLLHLGPGLGNGLANLHNARRAHTPVVNIVGDHATFHKQYDAQLESDIETVARNVSLGFIRRSLKTSEIGQDASDTVAASYGPPGQVATLLLPADVSWGDGGTPGKLVAAPRASAASSTAAVESALQSGEPAALMIGGLACRAAGVRAAAAVAAGTGAKLLCETFPARLERGAGLPPVDRLAYLAEFAAMQLDGLKHLILVDAKPPVSFFAYPGKASDLVPDGCTVHKLDVASLLALASSSSFGAAPVASLERPPLPTGPLTAQTVCAAMGALMPENAIVSDEGNTAGLFAPGSTAGAPAHDWLCLTGGAIGQGLPVALGASIACPDRPVIALQADGSALYTIQSLWTMAREQCNVTTILLNNHSYAVLNMELGRVGASAAGPRAKEMLDLTHPDLDFVAIATGLGVPATRATDASSFCAQLAAALASPGPHLVEAIIPSTL
jgi:acetolactate synthase-1/2/3 large subunit